MTVLHSVDFFPSGNASVAIEPRLPQADFPEHHHDFHEIVIVEHGTGIHVFNGQPYTITGGTVCFVRDHDRHLYEHTDNLCLTNVLYRSPDRFQFLAGLNQLLPQELDGQYPSHWRVNHSVLQQVRQLVAQMEQQEGENDLPSTASREILFMQLLLLLCKSSLQENLENSASRLNLLLAWLEDHFAESLTGHRVIFARDGMAFCNNANLLNVFVRHIANNQLRSLAEVATVAHQLKLLKDDFFASDQQAVAVADRYPQDVFAEHTHDFCELVIVWRGNGLHVLNDRPYRITRGDLFYIHADDKHSYASVNDLVLQNIIYCPERLKLNLDWQGAIPGFNASAGQPHWRLGSMGMAQARQVIGQLEHESSQHVPFANEMAELLFGQLVMLLNRHRYTSDSLPPTSSETLLDKLITRLAASLKSPFALDKFCDEASCSERVLRQQFRQQTGMTINQYLRQVRVCHAQYLLQHSRLLISDISTECGFEDSNYFSVVFTRETGMTPSQWRHLNSQKD